MAEMLEDERAHLMPMPTPFAGYVEKPARVSGIGSARDGGPASSAMFTGRVQSHVMLLPV